MFCQQFPGEMNSILFEIVAEGKVTQHLKKCMMAVGMPNVFEIVMLATHAHAFLAGSGPLVGPILVSEKDILELVHAGIGKQKRWILKGNQRCTGNDLMLVALEIFKEAFANLIAACQFTLPFQSAAKLLRGSLFSTRCKYFPHQNLDGANA